MWAGFFLVSCIEVADIPFTLCHTGLMDTVSCKTDIWYILHLSSREQGDTWHLESLLVSMVNTVTFHDSAQRRWISYILCTTTNTGKVRGLVPFYDMLAKQKGTMLRLSVKNSLTFWEIACLVSFRELDENIDTTLMSAC